jgi:hypothetical protein
MATNKEVFNYESGVIKKKKVSKWRAFPYHVNMGDCVMVVYNLDMCTQSHF